MKKLLNFSALRIGVIIALTIAFLSFDGFSPASPDAIGTRTILLQDADQAVTNNTFVNTDLTTPIAANQRAKVRFFVPFTLAGTASGIKFTVDAPATPTAYVSSVTIIADDATVALESVVTTEGAQGVTLANAGNHLAIIEATVENGANAGNVTLQFAQNVTDAGAATILRGGTVDVTKW